MKSLSFRLGAGLMMLGLIFTLSGFPVHSQDNHAQTLESDDPHVVRGGTWSPQTAAAASNGSYLYSSGAADDMLGLSFVGSAIEVLYVAGPSLGTLAIEVDGTVLRTVITTADQTAYQQSARVDYLSDEPHALKVYAQEGGIVAVDAFVITPHAAPTTSGVEDDSTGGIQSSTCAPLNVIHRVSLTHLGAQTNNYSLHSRLSSTGRYVVFESAARLVPADNDVPTDIYVYDRQTCTVQLISVSSTGIKGNSSSGYPAISANGRYVAFDSVASNLVTGDTNGQTDIFVHDRQTGTTTRVSVATGGTEATGGGSQAPAISSDGRFVAFQSYATNLVANDTNAAADIFLHDRQTGTTTRVSVSSTGTEATGGFSQACGISNDGRFIVFDSVATNLVTGDTNGAQDTFVHDRVLATTTRVSVATGGAQGTGGFSIDSAISGDGRYVTFYSGANNLVAGDSNGLTDIFVHDRQTGTTTRVSVATGGAQATGGGSFDPVLSGDGRFVVFFSQATNLVAGDTNGQNDIFLHDRQTGTTTRVSVSSNGTQGVGGNSGEPAISADGRYLAFSSAATNLVSGDTNGFSDIFVAPRLSPAVDTLALFNPPFESVGLFDTLADNPIAENYTTFSAYTPSTTPGQWVMGDWNGDGLDTPGVYANFVFYFTNKASESQASDWGGFWIGVNGPPVVGRFSNASPNDCVGAVDSAPYSGMTIFALYFTCDFSGTNPAPPLTFQWLSAPLPDPTFTGTFQFMAGDFNGDGLDSIAVRRNEFIAFGNVAPATGPATFDLAQYIGAPGTGDNGSFVVGDWDGNGLDSFGLFYQNGELFYRNDLDFNTGIHLNQSVGTPFGNTGVQAASWR
ncbi:MAG: hypothetical protein K8L91_27760 [Anaerolineae bacterium]|nr:hypothetical protein [Anaerolineae bacterium]